MKGNLVRDCPSWRLGYPVTGNSGYTLSQVCYYHNYGHNDAGKALVAIVQQRV